MDNFSLEEIRSVNAGLDVTIIIGDTVLIGNNADSASSYTWSPNYFIADINAVNATVNPPVTTTYYVTKTQCSVDFATTINKEKIITKIKVYPNPVSNWLTISVKKNSLGKVKTEVFDLAGKLILADNQLLQDEFLQVNLSSIIDGIYLLKLTFSDGTSEVLKVKVGFKKYF